MTKPKYGRTRFAVVCGLEAFYLRIPRTALRSLDDYSLDCAWVDKRALRRYRRRFAERTNP
jgi:hypothetical protein